MVAEIKETKQDDDAMDPKGGVVCDAPIADDVVDAATMPLIELIELVLDRQVSNDAVASFVAHCGWR